MESSSSLKATFALLAVLCAVPWHPVAAAELSEADIKALENQCETARETRLKPLREAEIARCKSDKHNDPAYCERYYRDFGDAMRQPDGTMKPRMFDDLPECV